MSSAARKAFDENLSDIERLITYYETAEAALKDSRKEVPDGADVVLRAAIVLLITYWEAYLEDVVAEALEHLVSHIDYPDKLPTELRKAVAKELKSDKHDLSPWKLAGDGWKQILKDRLPDLKKVRNRSFNTPKSRQTKEFISAALGITDITQAWHIDNLSVAQNCRRLDRIIEARGRIAHRGKLPERLTVRVTKEAAKFIRQLVGKTGGHINSVVTKVTAKSLW